MKLPPASWRRTDVALFLLPAILFPLMSLRAQTSQLAARRMNVVFIVVDDLNTDLGVYGHPVVKTPNLDRLARRGVRFDRAYAQYPMCNPSRNSFLSGRRPETIDIYDNKTNLRQTLRDAVVLPQHFRKQGYFTLRIGKIFHDELYQPDWIIDDPRSWDMTINTKGTARHLEGEGRNLTNGKYGFFRYLIAAGGDDEQPDGQSALEAVRFLERHRRERHGEPFFLALGLRKPHNPYNAPRAYFDLYPLGRTVPNKGPVDDLADIPKAAFPAESHNLGEQEGREFVRAYYACNSFMDAQVGRVTDALDRLKLTDNTLIVFFSDHGLHLGEHNWWNKVTLFERSARVPLIISGPNVKAAGKVSPRTVELLDLYPTLTGLCGLPQPQGLEGTSLQPLLNDPAAAWNRAAYTVLKRGDWMGRSVRTETYRYTEWDEGRQGRELYDHASDPHEYRNLAMDPSHSETIERMIPMLRQRTPDTSEKGNVKARSARSK